MEFAAYCFTFSTWLVTVVWLMHTRPGGRGVYVYLSFLGLICIGLLG